MKTLSFALILLLLSNLNSCKDREIQPDDVSREYILKGKLLNGTTMEPLYPGLWLNLKVSDMSALPSPKFETIGSCQIQQDGSFELQYPHNKLAQSLNASMRFESSFYISPTLPRNQDVDTVLYKSSWGGGNITFKSQQPISSNDTFYVALCDSVYKFRGPMSIEEIRAYRCKNIKASKVYYWAIGKNNFDSTFYPVPQNQRIYYIPSGDPYIDKLTIEY